MTDLLWPGDERAGDLFSDADLVSTLIRVEQAWLDSLVAQGVAPAEAAAVLPESVDLETLAADAAADGNVVIPLVAGMRAGLEQPASDWLHRGLTSQDVLDTALMLMGSRAVARVERRLVAAAAAAARLAETHRESVMAGRTLTQLAVPTTFGLTATGWLAGCCDGLEDLRRLDFPVQLGGAAGTSAALVELAGDRAEAVVAQVAAGLELLDQPAWHTVRTPMTRLGDALARVGDACGHVATDVLVLSRPEIAELREPSPGGSSTMPQKQNPVLATLIRRAALSLPGLAAQLHLAAADAHDQRPAGAWHLEGAVLRDLVRRTVVAVDQTADLLQGLEVDAERMRARVEESPALLAEQRVMARLAGHDPGAAYLGATDRLVDRALARARDLGVRW